MPNLDFHSVAVLAIVFLSGIVITVGIVLVQQRSRNRALDLLRVYAEKGQEPPAEVVRAIGRLAPGARVRRA